MKKVHASAKNCTLEYVSAVIGIPNQVKNQSIPFPFPSVTSVESIRRSIGHSFPHYICVCVHAYLFCPIKAIHSFIPACASHDPERPDRAIRWHWLPKMSCCWTMDRCDVVYGHAKRSVFCNEYILLCQPNNAIHCHSLF